MSAARKLAVVPAAARPKRSGRAANREVSSESTAERAPRSNSGRSRSDAPPRKADQVALGLLRRITSRQLPVGSLLPKEAELAVEFGVNRGVIREAVKLLEVHRLLSPVRRRGTEVLEPLHSMSPEVLVAMLVPRAGHIDKKTLEAFLEIRALLDVEMIALATERRSAADLKAMRARLAELGQLVDDAGAFARSVVEMAFVFARATKNPVFEMFAAFNGRVVRELEQSLVTTRPAPAEHVEGLSVIVDVIEQRDVESARRIVAAFHAWSTPRILASAALAGGASLTQLLEKSR